MGNATVEIQLPVIRQVALHAAVGVVSALAGAVTLLLAVARPERLVSRPLALVMSVGAAAVGGWFLLRVPRVARRRVSGRMSAEGLWLDLPPFCGLVRWDDIAGFGVLRVADGRRYGEVVGVVLRNSRDYEPGWLLKANYTNKGYHLLLRRDDLDRPARETVELLRRHHERLRAPRAPQAV